jgi:ABC-type nitrate/sulfonate/bicarbonate transport system substrate-binding protein
MAFVAGGQNAIPYSLIVQPDIKSFNDLRGKSLATSSLTSGATVILRKIMGANGLRDSDYDIVPAGGTAERYAAIRSGTLAGGLLLQPEDYMIMADGFPRLAYATDYIKKYQWVVMAVHKSWARDNEDKLVRVLRAQNDAYRWVYDPRNRDETIALIVETQNTTEPIARATYELYVDQLKIWPTAGEIDQEALREVIQLMGELGQLQAPLPEPSRYIDPSYLQKATAGR